MATAMGATGMVLAGVSMNVVKDIGTKHDPFPTALAGGMLAFITGALASWNVGLGTAFAALFLFGSFLTSGVYIFNAASAAISSKKG